MRIWVMSDLHLEFLPLPLPLTIPDADVCVCAGDVLTKGITPSLQWLAENIVPHMPVVFVAGNHEFYGAAFEESREAGKTYVSDVPGLHYLDGDTVEVGGARFTGGTLWTDFCLQGQQESALLEAKARMNDYRKIKFSKRPFRKFLPFQSVHKHRQDRTAIEEAILMERQGPLVVVTHHAPSALSLPEGDRSALISAAYASDLTGLIETGRPDLWIHGHIHQRQDYRIGTTRIIANPRGYPGENTFAGFDSAFVVNA